MRSALVITAHPDDVDHGCAKAQDAAATYTDARKRHAHPALLAAGPCAHILLGRLAEKLQVVATD